MPRSQRTPLALLMLVVVASCASTAPAAPQRLRVLAYNIKHGLGMDGVLDLERVAAVIRAQDADVVTLQEVDQGCARSGAVDQARVLGELCGMQASFGPFMDYDGGRYGMAVLSSLPMVESANHVLPDGAEPRSALEVRLLLPGGAELFVTGVHLYRTEQERLAQARALRARYAGETRPVLLAGDFNSERGSAVMQLLEEEWSNPRKDGPPETFPADTPEREIDFVLARGVSAAACSLRVVRERVASDHRPILFETDLPEIGQQPEGWSARCERRMQRTVDGQRLRYLQHAPAAATCPPEGWPLLLFLHGAGERGDDLDLVRVHGPPKLLGRIPELSRCVLVAPQCPADAWWQPETLRALVDEVCASTRVDPRRLYVTGLSMGGYGTWRLVAEYPELFAAAAPICGGGDPARLWSSFEGVPAYDLDGLTRATLALHAFHGADDDVVPVEESRLLLRALAAAGRDAELTVYPGVGHDSWTRTYADRSLYTWLLQQRRSE